MDYQLDYTENPVARRNMYDEAGRRERASKIIAVLKDHYSSLDGLNLLDMSCSAGYMTNQFGDFVKKAVGIDIDEGAVAFATENNGGGNIEFLVRDALNTRFEDSSFDVVVCNQMYEHVPDSGKLFKEIYRILKPGGVCYFGATNRLNPIETHYGKLPFLSYLPKPLAHLYLRLLKRGRYYYETFHTYWGLKRITADFERLDYTIAVTENPQKFSAVNVIRPGSAGQRLALFILKRAYWLSPGYIWLLRKKVEAV